MSSLVSHVAPNFVSSVVLADGSIQDQFDFHEATQGRYKVLFFYPLDFTFVCPSELIALDNRIEEFTKRGVDVLSVSIDSKFTHAAWRNTLVDNGGIGPVRYTMVSDVSHAICQAYGVEHQQEKVALRGTFIIDQNNIVRAELNHDLPLGRNINEIIRVLDALQFHEQHGEVCPVNWKSGEKGMIDTHEGVSEYLAEHAENL